MIGYFPTPYPDELFYSVCARFQERARYRTRSSLSQALFGFRIATAKIALPTGMDHLINSFPTSAHRITADRLIDSNTLLPYYSPFLPRERVPRIRELMRSGSSTASPATLCGINKSNIRNPDWLRFCVKCVEEDRKQDRKNAGEAYWRRVHQVPGVEVCPFHAVFLEDTEVRARNGEDAHNYVAAEKAILIRPARPLDPSDRNHAVLLDIACGTLRLLKGGGAASTAEFIRDRYIQLLSKKGLAMMTGTIRVRKFMKELKSYYPREVLQLLQCDFDETSIRSWPARIVKRLGCDCGHHPLHHLLLMQFLGQTVDTFFSATDEYKPFGDGPWPCLNPACDRLPNQQIEQCLIVHRRIGRRGTLPVATFCCPCGFKYERIGPDIIPEDRRRLSRIIAYGHAWDAKLRELWSDSTLDLRRVAAQLGISYRRRIKREAERLGLPFPRIGPGGRAAVKSKHSKSSNSSFKDTRSAYRKEWKAALKKKPALSRWALRKRFTRLANWLSRNDHEWLQAHLPPRRKRTVKARVVDWQGRDETLQAAVRASAAGIRKRHGRPVWITRARIGKDITQDTMLKRYLDRLPRTKKALAEVVETRIQFAKRRIAGATDYFRKAGICPARSILFLRAGLTTDLRYDPEISEAIDDALRSLGPRANNIKIALAS